MSKTEVIKLAAVVFPILRLPHGWQILMATRVGRLQNGKIGVISETFEDGFDQSIQATALRGIEEEMHGTIADSAKLSHLGEDFEKFKSGTWQASIYAAEISWPQWQSLQAKQRLHGASDGMKDWRPFNHDQILNLHQAPKKLLAFSSGRVYLEYQQKIENIFGKPHQIIG